MFGPGSLTWRVNGEAVLLLGGGRALLLQVAHPGVAAGVAEFSNYREDPWRRLYRTLDTTLSIVFGDDETSKAASTRLRRVHTRVAGTDDRGEPYRALDPELLLWVHATLIDTSLAIYTRYVAQLTARRARALLRRDEDARRGLLDPARGDARRLRRVPPLLGHDAGRRPAGDRDDPRRRRRRPATRPHAARMAGRRAPAHGDGGHSARRADERTSAWPGARPASGRSRDRSSQFDA